MKTYHVLKDGENQGPFTLDEMQSRMQRQYFADDDLCWTEGMEEWEPVKRVISAVQASSPPPTPKAPPPPVQEPDRTATLNPNFHSADGGGEGPQRRPWVRLWARAMDIFLFGFIIGVFVLMFPTNLGFMLFFESEVLSAIIIGILYIPLDAWMISTWGTSPFKALLRVSVRKRGGAKLSYQEALERSWKVLVYGLGLNIPILSLIMPIRSRKKLETEGATKWDEEGGLVVEHKLIGVARTVVAVLIGIGMILLVIMGQEA